MVLMAFRGANPNIAATTVPILHKTAAEPTHLDAQAFNHGLIDSPPLFEVTSADSLASEYETRPPISLEEDPGKFDFYQKEEAVDRNHGVQANSLTCLESPFSGESDKRFEGFVQSFSITDRDNPEVDNSQGIDQSSDTESTVESVLDGATLSDERLEDQLPSREEAATDPWDHPLAAWDYSRSEWPGLEASTRRNPFSKPRMAIAFIVLIASSAGFYFLVLRPSNPQRRAVADGVGTAQVSAVQPLSVSAGAANSEAVAAAVTKQSGDAAAATSKPDDSAVGETPASDDSALGQFSLQAAAFPTQNGADEFAEKLKQAGLASYVVPADIARRGRWFRVRVGRFDSAEDAQKFAGEAQRRARAAGFSLQLIVCQYGKP